ncbi:Phosphoribosylaminoimidazole carboxylase [Melanogaster broomeanus]|nr:Phosphoribosylaminoimidazole carboxylase [Melanogaster broomeanus]
MLAASASLLNVDVVILDVGEYGPAKQILAPRSAALSHIDGSFTDPEKIRELAAEVPYTPALTTIGVIQDKLQQKYYMRANGCPVDSSVESIQATATQLGLPFMLKTRTLAYDGRGNFVRWVPFVKEIAVMVVRATDGEVVSYPAENICHLVFAPLRSHDPLVASRAQRVAESAVKTLSGAGVFGVEMFLMEDGTIYINEIAPRPHNSGHYTIEACETSQYENHLRAILSLPLGSTSLKVPSAAMLNIIGSSSSMSPIQSFAAPFHLYGKSESRKGRKMGHVTIVADSDASPPSEIDTYAPLAPAPGSGFSSPHPLVGIVMGSDSDLPVMLPAARILDRFAIPYELTIPDRMVSYARSASATGPAGHRCGRGRVGASAGHGGSHDGVPVVGVPVKGSSLDGVDSLHSIVQMPRGMNAGLLAVRILGAGMPHLFTAMDEYLKGLETEVLGKVNKLAEIGWEQYEVKR